MGEESRSKTRRQRKEGTCWINRETEKGKIKEIRNGWRLRAATILLLLTHNLFFPSLFLPLQVGKP